MARSDTDFDEYVRANGGRLLRFAYLQSGDPHTAQDLVQAVLCRALPAWTSISAGNADAYLRRAIVNERTTLWRRFGRREHLGPHRPGPGVGVDITAVTDIRDQLVAALRQLPARQRAAVVLRYLEDMPDSEIADVIGCTQATVRSHILRGLARLRPLLEVDHTSPDPERIDT